MDCNDNENYLVKLNEAITTISKISDQTRTSNSRNLILRRPQKLSDNENRKQKPEKLGLF